MEVALFDSFIIFLAEQRTSECDQLEFIPFRRFLASSAGRESERLSGEYHSNGISINKEVDVRVLVVLGSTSVHCEYG